MSEPKGPSKKQLNKEAKKKQKEDMRKKKKVILKKKKREEEQKKPSDNNNSTPTSSEYFGNLPLLQSVSREGKNFTEIRQLDQSMIGKPVLIRARLHNVRSKGNLIFFILRDRLFTVQVVIAKGGNVSKEMIEFCKKVSEESIVQIEGKAVEPATKTVESCTQKDVEVFASHVFIFTSSDQTPFSVESANRSVTVIEQRRKEVEEVTQELNNTTDPEKQKELKKKLEELPTFPEVKQATRLDNRIIDLRTPTSHAIFKIQSAVCQLFREFLLKNEFMEIHSPKLLGTASESGSSVFKVEYFNSTAYLAQSPQFYKQMAIASDFERVFEIAPVFRAEKAFTHRHLTEFVGLDLEMTFKEHYHEVTDFLDQMLSYIFEGLETRWKKELEVINEQYPFPPFKYKRGGGNLRLTYPEAIKMLNDAGVALGEYDDIDLTNEKLLGKLVLDKYDTDFYWIDKFPADERPFYSMPDPSNPKRVNSYDFFMRGQEILSGAQRVHVPEILTENVIKKGVNPETVKDYIDSFRFGCKPHAGAGIGLERVVFFYLGLHDIRQSSLFPRDPQRIHP